MGRVDFDVALALQNRLVYEASGRADGQMALVLCEHPATLAIGRRGSRSQIHLSDRDLASHQIAERWVNHGGGCLLHLPGQLAIYPIIPIGWHGWLLGEYLDRLHTALRGVLEELHFKPTDRPVQIDPARAAQHARVADHSWTRMRGLWGRTGQLTALAVAVKHDIAYYGAFVNVSPAVDLFRFVESDPASGVAMSSLVAERQQPVRMTTVREAVVRHVAQALECHRIHMHSGHPLLSQIAHTVRDSARVG